MFKLRFLFQEAIENVDRQCKKQKMSTVIICEQESFLEGKSAKNITKEIIAKLFFNFAEKS